MYKCYTILLLFLLSYNACSQENMQLYSKETKRYPRINIPFSASEELVQAAYTFNLNFKKTTGEVLNVERSNNLNKNYTYISLRVNPTQNDLFCYYKKDNNITIQGTSNDHLIMGIHAFFEKFTTLSYVASKQEMYDNTFVDNITLPNEFSECFSPDFEYREPYFSPNFEKEFRDWNKTNFLELEWGIWGHNLPKILKGYKLPETVFAKVGNKRIEDQFCFTSDSLFQFVNEKVTQIYNSDFALNKYMILPNDNSLVCTCNTCKSVGNTKKNAAPAVFTFLNKLAKNHPKATFYTTAYITVNDVPNFTAAKNTGVFYSTIQIQKGIPIKKSKYAKKFESDVKKWSNYVNHLYIWDYAVNFDNYFDLYPIVKTAQENLTYYKELGVNGVFMHGSEYNYSTFQELKTILFSKLLWNTNININQEIRTYFKEKYPSLLSDILINFYTFSEDAFLRNKEELGIYSGINSTTQKYLDPKIFFGFYKEFDNFIQNNKYDKDFLKIATAFTFLKLEIMRDTGLGNYGYGKIKNESIIIDNEVGILLDKLNAYSKSSKVTTYNEVKYTIDDYIKNWRNKIFTNHKRKHYFYKKPFEVISNLDEDYQNESVLNDAAFGLLDYNTNWMINSIDNLTLKIEKSEISKSSKITFSFLQDLKHKIYYPSVIEILNNKEKVIKKLKLNLYQDKLATKEITIDLPNKYDSNQLTDTFYIKIHRSKNEGKNAMACDEIIFN